MDVLRHSQDERCWTITRPASGPLVATGRPDWLAYNESVEVVSAEQLQGAVAALMRMTLVPNHVEGAATIRQYARDALREIGVDPDTAGGQYETSPAPREKPARLPKKGTRLMTVENATATLIWLDGGQFASRLRVSETVAETVDRITDADQTDGWASFSDPGDSREKLVRSAKVVWIEQEPEDA